MLPLSNFGTVSFADATAGTTAIGNENPGALTMVSANDVTEATPSALTGGNAFTVTWDSNGTTATAARRQVPPQRPARAARRAGITTATITGSVTDRRKAGETVSSIRQAEPSWSSPPPGSA